MTSGTASVKLYTAWLLTSSMISVVIHTVDMGRPLQRKEKRRAQTRHIRDPMSIASMRV
jgi:hypothetical protein